MAQRGRPVTLSDDDLLATAREVFLERGLDATTSEIAKRVQISESVIFHRYKTKEALMLAVLEREMVVPPEVAGLPALVGKGEIADHLFQMGMALIEMMKTVHPLLMMAFSSPMRLNELHDRVSRAHPLVRLVKLFTGYFEAESRLGRLRPLDAEILARTFLGSVKEFTVSQFFEHIAQALPMAPATYLRGMINLLLEGAKVGSEARRAHR